MVDPLRYCAPQMVLKKGCGMCYPVCGIVHILFTVIIYGVRHIVNDHSYS